MNDRIREWDERFARGEDLPWGPVSAPLPLALEGVAPGRAVDLACGMGRHTLFLAQRGWRVEALDASQAGLDRTVSEAQRRGLAALISTRRVDLESPSFTLEPDSCDLACDFYFLHRPLFDQIRRAVRPGGRFVAAIHLRTSEDTKGRFLLQPGELRGVVESWGWEILRYREGRPGEGGHTRGSAELIARRFGDTIRNLP